MKNWKTILATSAIGAGVIALGSYAMRMTRTGAQLESMVKAKVHSLKLDGLTIRVDVQLKNPGKTAFKIKFPFVKIIHEGKTVGSSESINKDIDIPAYGQAMIDAVMIKMPFTGMLSLGSGLLSTLTKNEPAIIQVSTITTIDLGWKKIPFEKAQDITLNA